MNDQRKNDGIGRDGSVPDDERKRRWRRMLRCWWTDTSPRTATTVPRNDGRLDGVTPVDDAVEWVCRWERRVRHEYELTEREYDRVEAFYREHPDLLTDDYELVVENDGRYVFLELTKEADGTYSNLSRGE